MLPEKYRVIVIRIREMSEELFLFHLPRFSIFFTMTSCFQLEVSCKSLVLV